VQKIVTTKKIGNHWFWKTTTLIGLSFGIFMGIKNYKMSIENAKNQTKLLEWIKETKYWKKRSLFIEYQYSPENQKPTLGEEIFTTALDAVSGQPFSTQANNIARSYAIEKLKSLRKKMKWEITYGWRYVKNEKDSEFGNNLKIKQKAPLFEALYVSRNNTIPKKIRLSDLIKKKKLILYFFLPNSCTGISAHFRINQAENLIRNYQKLKEQGYEVVGVSTDNFKSHLSFIKRHNLPFKLISDPKETLHKKYTAWSEKDLMKMMKGNWWMEKTFVINTKGVITQIINQGRAEQIISGL